MTGFGRGDARGEGVHWHVECSSVNRKQLEVAVSLPRELAELEIAVRGKVAGAVSRGRVAVSVKCDAAEMSGSALRVDETLAEKYLTALRGMAGRFDLAAHITAADLARWPGVFQIESGQCTAETAWPLIEEALEAALGQMLAMRVKEGAHLRDDVEGRLRALDKILAAVRELAPGVPLAQRKALQQRLAEAGLPLPLEDERLVKEIALFAERADISEELARSDSHLRKFRELTGSKEPAGRSMDFLTQELFREFNTMGAKANSARIAHHVVDAKTEIEKIREQVQNVE